MHFWKNESFISRFQHHRILGLCFANLIFIPRKKHFLNHHKYKFQHQKSTSSLKKLVITSTSTLFRSSFSFIFLTHYQYIFFILSYIIYYILLYSLLQTYFVYIFSVLFYFLLFFHQSYSDILILILPYSPFLFFSPSDNVLYRSRVIFCNLFLFSS